MCMHLSGSGYVVPFLEKVDFYLERPIHWFLVCRDTRAKHDCPFPV